MSKPLILFEHECTTFTWTDRDLALLERLRASTHTDVLKATVKNGKRAIQAMQHVGVVRLGNRTIQVLPKIYQSQEAASTEAKEKEATANKHPPSTDEKKVWKIAPGPQAKYWDQCRESKCIAISFLNDADFRSFKDRDAIKQTLVESGQKAGNDLAIWRFTHRMKLGDIVVANQGISDIVGIGIIESDYIAPTDPNNPSEIPDYGHARRIDWLITEPMAFSERLFIQQTVGRVEEADWQTIKQAYLARNPALQTAFQKLEGKPIKVDEPAEPMLQELRELISLSTRTRNIILYGPPGTS